MFPTYFTWSHAEKFDVNTPVREHQVGVYIATAGNLTILDRGGNTVTFNSLAVGAHPILCRQITAAPANTLVLYA